MNKLSVKEDAKVRTSTRPRSDNPEAL